MIARAHMKPITVFTAILAMACAWTSFADASDNAAERLYTRGILALETGNVDEALPLFEKAIDEAPQDPEARYHWGVALRRTGKLKRSAEAFEKALELRPDFHRAAFELGHTRLKLEEYGAAAEAFDFASNEPTLEAEALFFLGLSQLRASHYEDSKRSFLRAAMKNPSYLPSSRYYAGLSSYRAGEREEARELFEMVVAKAPNSAVAAEAQRMLDSPDKAGEARNYVMYGRLVTEYDSNVVLSPSDDAAQNTLAITDRDDGRVVLQAGITYIPYRTESLEVAAGYELSQSLHFDLTDNNLQDHRASLLLASHSGVVRYGVANYYDFYVRETDSFLHSFSSMPWLAYDDDNFGTTEVYYRAKLQEFIPDDFSRLRDSWNHAVGIRQHISLGADDRILTVGYRFDREDNRHSSATPALDGRQFAYDGHQAEVSLSLQLPSAVHGQVGYVYRNESFDDESGDRRDDEHRLLVSLRHALCRDVDLVAAYLGTYNESNDAFFEYDRHIGSLALEFTR